MGVPFLLGTATMLHALSTRYLDPEYRLQAYGMVALQAAIGLACLQAARTGRVRILAPGRLGQVLMGGLLVWVLVECVVAGQWLGAGVVLVCLGLGLGEQERLRRRNLVDDGEPPSLPGE